jgi:CheY-like chemotaxis protein
MPDMINLSRNQHVMLLYENNFNRDLASIKYINQGLKEKQLCIYASVNTYDTTSSSSSPHLTKMSAQIEDYKENINKRNLLIVNLKPFYDSALARDLTPFEEFEMQLRQELKNRDDNSKDVLIIADCADNLFSNKCFDQCDLVEKWWQGIYLKWLHQQQQQQQQQENNNLQNHFTIICPYPSSLLRKHPFDQHKHQISHNHSITIDTAGRIILTTGYPTTKGGEKEETQVYRSVRAATTFPIELTTQILVAEPEPDLQELYRIWLHSMGFKDIVITDNGKKCLEEIVKITDSSKSKTQGFDMIIILDTHIKDIPCIQLAKQIVNKKPDQQIIFTTTLSSDSLQEDIGSIGIKNNNNNNKNMILTKPFGLSKLLPLIGRSIKNQQQQQQV